MTVENSRADQAFLFSGGGGGGGGAALTPPPPQPFVLKIKIMKPPLRINIYSLRIYSSALIIAATLYSIIVQLGIHVPMTINT